MNSHSPPGPACSMSCPSSWLCLGAVSEMERPHRLERSPRQEEMGISRTLWASNPPTLPGPSPAACRPSLVLCLLLAQSLRCSWRRWPRRRVLTASSCRRPGDIRPLSTEPPTHVVCWAHGHQAGGGQGDGQTWRQCRPWCGNS